MKGNNWIVGAVAAVGCVAALLAPRPAAAQCAEWSDGYGGWHARHRYVSVYYDGYHRRHCYPRYRSTMVVVYRSVPVYRRHRHCRRVVRRHYSSVYIAYGGSHYRHHYGCY